MERERNRLLSITDNVLNEFTISNYFWLRHIKQIILKKFMYFHRGKSSGTPLSASTLLQAANRLNYTTYFQRKGVTDMTLKINDCKFSFKVINGKVHINTDDAITYIENNYLKTDVETTIRLCEIYSQEKDEIERRIQEQFYIAQKNRTAMEIADKYMKYQIDEILKSEGLAYKINQWDEAYMSINIKSGIGADYNFEIKYDSPEIMLNKISEIITVLSGFLKVIRKSRVNIHYSTDSWLDHHRQCNGISGISNDMI